MTFSFSEREDTACSLVGGEGAWQHIPSSRMEAWGPAHVTPQLPCTGTAEAHASPSSPSPDGSGEARWARYMDRRDEKEPILMLTGHRDLPCGGGEGAPPAPPGGTSWRPGARGRGGVRMPERGFLPALELVALLMLHRLETQEGPRALSHMEDLSS